MAYGKDFSRFTETKLDAADRPRTLYIFWVTGKGSFPLDMLRYDCCWPATGLDAEKVTDFDRETHSDLYSKPRSIRMMGYRAPEPDRWSSFGWSMSPTEFKVS